MKVKELIEELENYPGHFNVDCISEHLLWNIEGVALDEEDEQ